MSLHWKVPNPTIRSNHDVEIICISRRIVPPNGSENVFNKIFPYSSITRGLGIILSFEPDAYIDSNGIGHMAAFIGQAKERGAEVRLAYSHKRILDMFQLMKVSSFAKIFGDVNEAVLSFGSDPVA